MIECELGSKSEPDLRFDWVNIGVLVARIGVDVLQLNQFDCGILHEAL